MKDNSSQDLFPQGPGKPPLPSETTPERKMERAYLASGAANLGIWDWDISKGQVYVSAQYMAMMGYKREASILRPSEWGLMMHPADSPQAWRAALNHMDGKSPTYEAEIRHRTKEGRWIWMLDRGRVVLRDEFGNPLRMVGTLADITMRKMMENALQKSQERWSQLFDETNDAIFVQELGINGTPGRFTELNDVACRMLGYDRDELMSLSAECIGLNLEHFTGPFGTKSPFRQEQLELNRKDGGKILVEVKSHAFELQGVLTCLAIARDITWRRQAEKALRDSQQRFLAAFKAQPDALIITSFSDGKLLEANDHFYRITGLDPAKALGKTTVELGIWHSVNQRNRLTESLKEKDGCDNLYQTFENLNKRKKHVLISARNLAIGEKKYILAILRDISEEVQLSRFQKVILEAADAMSLGIGVLRNSKEQSGNFVYANHALVSMLGFSRNQIINHKNLKEFTSEKDKRKIERLFSKKHQANKSFSVMECNLIKKDGESILARMVSAATEIDEKPGLVLFCQDITEERRMAKRLVHSQKMESIGTLASGIAHDFNNILTIIMGFTQVALNDVLKGNNPHEDLEEVLTACRRARDLVKQMLTFGHAKQGDKRVMNIQVLLKSFIKFIRSPVPSNIDINLKILNKDAFVMADPTGMQQILLNLCTNAVQAMEPDPGVLEIILQKTTIGPDQTNEFNELSLGEYVKLSISDTGKGMAPHVAERIFEPFFTTKAREQGTGLGLSVVHGIVKSHSGAIRLSTEPNKGSSFSIFLPAVERDIYEGEEVLALKPAIKGHQSILLVDDEPALAAAVKENMEKLGYQVKSFVSSTQALRAFRREPAYFDLIMADYSMPVMGGPELVEKALKIKPGLPVILCTGYGTDVMKQKLNIKGNLSWLFKPFGLEELAQAINKALENKK